MKKIIAATLLLISLASASFADPHAFPVPYVSKNDTLNKGIFFTDLPANGTIRIVTVSGEEVIKLDILPSAGNRQWFPVNNSAGKPVQTGVYLFLVDGDGQTSTGKLVVVR